MFFAPEKDCQKCPRLVAFRRENQEKFPSFFNGAVPAFGSLDAKFLVIGLAPGLKGANQTGRPFTGDYAGDVLYGALKEEGLASGNYAKHAEDGFMLHNVRITNAVRCVPPQNKPTPDEVKSCAGFLMDEIANMPNLQLVLCLGRVSHEAFLRVLKLPVKQYPFGHGAQHTVFLPDGRQVALLDSYHTSRYNIQTNRLTFDMFKKLINSSRGLID